MLSGAIPGYEAKVYTSSDGGTTFQEIGEMKNVTLDIKRKNIMASSHQAGGWERRIPGMKDWSAQAEAFYLKADASQNMVLDSLFNNTALYFRFYPKLGVTLDKYEGFGLISNWKYAGPTEDAAAVSLDFEGDGALTKGAQ